MLDVTRLRVLDAARAARLGHGGGEGAALHAADGQPPPRPARGRDRGAAAATGRARDPAHPRRELLADRAAEILGRLDAADAELAAHVGLSAGRVRLAGFSSVIGSLVPRAVAALTRKHPGLQIGLTDTHPPEALELLRTGKIDVAIIFRYDETEPEPDDVRLHHLLDDPLYLLSTRAGHTLAHTARRHLDRRLRPVPQPPAVDVRRRGVRTQDRLHLRRHGRDAGAGRRRTRS